MEKIFYFVAGNFVLAYTVCMMLACMNASLHLTSIKTESPVHNSIVAKLVWLFNTHALPQSYLLFCLDTTQVFAQIVGLVVYKFAKKILIFHRNVIEEKHWNFSKFRIILEFFYIWVVQGSMQWCLKIA